LHVLDNCKDDNYVQLFTKDTFATATNHTEEADIKAAVGGGECADFSLD
jgi:hypothetical protein